MDLDDRIREILENHEQSIRERAKNTAWTIARIKQAFEGAGYRPNIGPYYDAMLDAIKKESGFMTGSEWYERFEKELEGFVDTNRRTQDYTDAILAARIASGIDKEPKNGK